MQASIAFSKILISAVRPNRLDYLSLEPEVEAGDEVVVRPGTYEERIDFLGKAITVRSEQGPDVTVIDGGSPSNPDRGSVVVFENGEGPDSVLDGFTLTNGTGTADGW